MLAQSERSEPWEPRTLGRFKPLGHPFPVGVVKKQQISL
jgi:hypothetical protein